MKNKNLQIGTLCTIRVDRHGYVAEEDRGYWVVTAIERTTPSGFTAAVQVFSLTHQQHWWRNPTDLIPVVNSGV